MLEQSNDIMPNIILLSCFLITLICTILGNEKDKTCTGKNDWGKIFIHTFVIH